MLTQWYVQLLLTNAGPKERAGFRLPPVYTPYFSGFSNNKRERNKY